MDRGLSYCSTAGSCGQSSASDLSESTSSNHGRRCRSRWSDSGRSPVSIRAYTVKGDEKCVCVMSMGSRVGGLAYTLCRGGMSTIRIRYGGGGEGAYIGGAA